MKSIKIKSCIKSVDIVSRCEYNSNLKSVLDIPSLKIPYYEEAIIPVGKWKPVNGDSLSDNMLKCIDDTKYYCTVSINVLPYRIFNSIKNAYNYDDHEGAIKLAKDFFSKKYECRHCDLNGGISEMAGMKPTVSYNSFDGKHVGLHVDSWDRLEIKDRHRAYNRLSINLGEEARYFMFVPLCLHSLDCNKYEIKNATDFGRFFIKDKNPVVVRVKISPGEYYIAPTENCIHDGSSLGIKSLDITLSLRGKIW